MMLGFCRHRASAALCILILSITTVHADGVIDIKPTGSATFDITQKGSYRLVSDVTMALEVPCISITANDVTLDLNGHVIEGNGADLGANGISGATAERVTIHNGTVRGFSLAGIAVAHFASIHDVLVQDNGGDGISAGDHAIIRNCRVEDGGKNGNCAGIRVTLNSLVLDCIVTGLIPSTVNASSYGISISSGSRVENNSCTGNTGSGNGAGVGIHASAGGNLILNNVCRSNQGGGNSGFGHGIMISNGSTNVVRGNTCTANSGGTPDGWGYGVRTFFGSNTIDGNTCSANLGQGSGIGVGIYCTQSGGVVTNNSCNGNDGGSNSGTGIGIQCSSKTRIVGNTCLNNSGSGAVGSGRGISASENCFIENNHCDNNSGIGTGTSIGIYGGVHNRIKGNYASGHDTAANCYGIRVTGGNNLISENFTSDNATAGIRLDVGGNRCELNRMTDATPISDVGGNEIGAGDLANEDF